MTGAAPMELRIAPSHAAVFGGQTSDFRAPWEVRTLPRSGDGRRITAKLVRRNAVMTLVAVPFGLEAAAGYANTIRRAAFNRRKNDPAYNGPIIIAEGDSWFCYPAEFPFAPADSPKDMIRWLAGHAASDWRRHEHGAQPDAGGHRWATSDG